MASFIAVYCEYIYMYVEQISNITHDTSRAANKNRLFYGVKLNF